jgi:hypothetical protein
MSTAPELIRLRAELASRFGDAILPAGLPARREEARPGLRVGVQAIDALLPGGVPRGAVSLWVGEGTSGRTAALRSLVERAGGAGAVVGVVDAGRTLDASFGSGVEGIWVARAPSGREREGPWAAEALLRAGVFDLVVLDGWVPEAAQAHRLRALARERDAALVVSAVGAGAPGWRADTRLEFRRGRGGGMEPGGRFRGRSVLRGERTDGREREVELVHDPADRLRPGAPSADRRPRAR